RTELRYPSAAVLREAWAAVRATRTAWGVSSLDDGEPATRPLWSATGVPPPAWMRPARPSPMPVIPVTRPSQDAAATARFTDASSARVEERGMPAPLEPSGEGAALDPARGGGRSRSAALLFVCACGLALLSVALFAGRDALFVPLLSAHPDYIGHFLRDARWTVVVNLAAAAAFALAALLG